MLPIALLSHGELVRTEIQSSLHRLSGVRLIVIAVPAISDERQARDICATIRRYECRVVFSLNNWGLDPDGVISGFLCAADIIHVNWHIDDPFFAETLFGIRATPAPNRLDFVSDRGYVQRLGQAGYRAWFLPLAADPTLFYPEDLPLTYDISFVGNSYRLQTERLLQSCPLPDHTLPLLQRLFDRHQSSPYQDIFARIRELLCGSENTDTRSAEKQSLAIGYFFGYLYRKKIILQLIDRYPDFTVFGDPAWMPDVPQNRLSTSVGYYANLREIYCRSRITIDINRTVIRDGFTQRIFDCPASGGFLITSPKPIALEFFETRGSQAEICMFETPDHLPELIDYYRAHDRERHAIALRGHRRVLAHHTYDHRIKELFQRVRTELGRDL